MCSSEHFAQLDSSVALDVISPILTRFLSMSVIACHKQNKSKLNGLENLKCLVHSNFLSTVKI